MANKSKCGDGGGAQGSRGDGGSGSKERSPERTGRPCQGEPRQAGPTPHLLGLPATEWRSLLQELVEIRNDTAELGEVVAVQPSAQGEVDEEPPTEPPLIHRPQPSEAPAASSSAAVSCASSTATATGPATGMATHRGAGPPPVRASPTLLSPLTHGDGGQACGDGANGATDASGVSPNSEVCEGSMEASPSLSPPSIVATCASPAPDAPGTGEAKRDRGTAQAAAEAVPLARMPTLAQNPIALAPSESLTSSPEESKQLQPLVSDSTEASRLAAECATCKVTAAWRAEEARLCEALTSRVEDLLHGLMASLPLDRLRGADGTGQGAAGRPADGRPGDVGRREDGASGCEFQGVGRRDDDDHGQRAAPMSGSPIKADRRCRTH